MLGSWQRRRRFRAAREQCQHATLTAWLDAAERLEPGPIRETPILVADLELTGLDPESDEIISIGWTEIAEGRIRMADNQHLLIRPEGGVGKSAAIHELRDRDLAAGIPLAEGLDALFTAARGKPFLFHHAGLDAACLQRACERWAGCRPPMPVLDTLRMEAERRQRRGQPIPDGALRLGALRSSYGLPEHALHDALGDAIATAELLLVMAARNGGRQGLDLAPLLRWL
ncbi:MAG: 3'-5' exonuclease [Pseudomonadota bacterium]